MAKKSIVLVEDEALIAILEKKQLEKMGYAVLHISNGEDAVQSVLNEEIYSDLILMDIDLGSGIDGTQAAEQILKEKDIPIVFLSSHTEPEVVERTEKITSYGYVVKNSGIVVLDTSIKMAFKLFEAKISEKRKTEVLKEKELQFKKLSANVPDLFFQFTRRTDGTYCIPIASEGIRNIFGCSPQEVVDDFSPVAKVLHPEDVERVMKDIEYSAEHLSYFTCEFRVQIPGKPVQWIFSRSAPEKLPDGSVTWYGFNADITERKQVEDALRASEQRLYELFERAPLGYQSLDNDGRFLIVNQEWLNTLGYTREEVLGKWFGDFLAPEYVQAFKERFPLFKAQGHIHSEFYMIHKDGHRIYIAFEGSIGHNTDGSFKQTHCILKDETKRKKAEEMIQKQLKEKDILLREVHHRVKNNIANIESFLHLQSLNSSNPEVQSALQNAVSRVQAMRVLYDKLLLSKDLNEVSLKNYLDDLIDSLFKIYSDEVDIYLNKMISDISLLSKEAIAIGIIVNELLTNVFKYAFKGRDKGAVSLSIEQEDHLISIIIKDDGIGTDSRILENKSTGMGLTIVRMLVDQQNGSYNIVNDNGTTHNIRLDIDIQNK